MSAPNRVRRAHEDASGDGRATSRAARLAGVLALAGAALLAAAGVLPARWAMAWVPDGAPVTLVDAQGSLWSAQATLAVGAGPLRRSLPEPLHWRFAFAGGPRVSVSHAWLGGPLEIRPAWGGVRISGQTLRVPAALLTALHAVFNTLEPGGDLLLQWPDLVVGRGGPEAAPGGELLRIRWRQAGSALSRVRPLGDYRLSVAAAAAGPEPGFALRLSTEDGPLRLDGAGTWSPSGRLVFDGRAWADASASPDTRVALRRLLDTLGPRTGPDGATLLRIRS